MKRYNLPHGDGYWAISEHIPECKSKQSPELIAVMEKKAEAMAGTYNFASYAERMMFIDAFIKGYIAAFIIPYEQEELELSLTPLSKAMNEQK